MPGNYNIPSPGTVGNIINADNDNVLNNENLQWEGLSSEMRLHTNGSDKGYLDQLWEIGLDDGSGFFSIKNPISGKFLNADPAGNWSLRGIYHVHTYLYKSLNIGLLGGHRKNLHFDVA